MNHQDFSSLLIGQGMNRLTDAERLDFQQHLSSCDDCARDWELHSRLVAQPVPPMPATLEARCRAAFAGRPDPGKGTRKSGRYVLIGTVLVLAAAAAMLALHLSRLDRSRAQPENPAIKVPQSVDPEGKHAVPEGAGTVPEGRDSEDAVAPASAQREFTVQVMPLIHDAKDPARQRDVQKHYDALLDGLRLVPGLRLLTMDAAGSPADTRPDFRFKVRNQDPLDPLQLEIPSDRWQVELTIDSRREDGNMETTSTRWYSGPLGGFCEPRQRYCQDAASIAAEQVDALRLEVFPPDPALTRSMETLLANTALPVSVREDALRKLLRRARKPDDWDAAAIRGAADLADTTDPLFARHIWKMLRGVRHPDIVKPLLNQVEREVDTTRRVEFVTILVQDFGAVPAAQQTLETLAKSDSRPLIRELAARALSGDSRWRQYALDTLKDARLPVPDRIEALEHMWWTSQQIALPAEHASLTAMLDNDEVLTQLAQILPQIWNRPRHRSQGAVNGSLSMAEDLMDLIVQEGGGTPLLDTLGSVDRPKAVEILLDALRNSPIPYDRIQAASQLGYGHIGDPRVAKALQDTAAIDPEPGVQRAAMRALQSNTSRTKAETR